MKYKWLSIHTKNKVYPYFFTNIINCKIDYLKNTIEITYHGSTIKTINTAIIVDFEAIMYSTEVNEKTNSFKKEIK